MHDESNRGLVHHVRSNFKVQALTAFVEQADYRRIFFGLRSW